MPDSATTDASTCSVETAPGGTSRWPEGHARAWIGLLETHKKLTRALDAALLGEHGIGLSALELLARLAAEDARHMHLSALAGASGLSLSRVSRIVDALGERALVRRSTCPSDARAVHAVLTDAGLALVRGAQATHLAWVQASFFDRLDEHEIATLARVFERFAAAEAGACEPGAAGAGDR